MSAAHALGVLMRHVEKMTQNVLGGTHGLALGEIPMLELHVRFVLFEHMFETNPTLPDLAIVVKSGRELDRITGGGAFGVENVGRKC